MRSNRSSASKREALKNLLQGKLGFLRSYLKEHETTLAESLVRSSVVEICREIGFVGKVFFNPLIIDSEGRARRPDICIPKLGLIIEVDGASHDRWARVISSDLSREEFYIELGFQAPFVITNHDAINDFRRGFLLRSVLKDFISHPKLTADQARHLSDRITSNYKLIPEELRGALAANQQLKHLQKLNVGSSTGYHVEAGGLSLYVERKAKQKTVNKPL